MGLLNFLKRFLEIKNKTCARNAKGVPKTLTKLLRHACMRDNVVSERESSKGDFTKTRPTEGFKSME